MKRKFVAAVLSLSIACSSAFPATAAPAAPAEYMIEFPVMESGSLYSKAYVVKTAHHTATWSGFMVLQRFDFWQRGERGGLLRVRMDPEDIVAGDLVSVTFYVPSGSGSAYVAAVTYCGSVH